MEQPFYIGQKVVCVSTCIGLIKGNHYTVLDVAFCSKCNIWWVGFMDEPSDNWFFCDCFTNINQKPYGYAYSHRFAPLQEGFEAITFERVMEEEKVSVN